MSKAKSIQCLKQEDAENPHSHCATHSWVRIDEIYLFFGLALSESDNSKLFFALHRGQ